MLMSTARKQAPHPSSNNALLIDFLTWLKCWNANMADIAIAVIVIYLDVERDLDL